MHVRGFTRHSNSGVPAAARGTYAGLIEKIPYLKQLGITAVEMLPVFQFDAQDCPPGRTNYWGYAPVSFFAPHVAYSSRRDPLGPLDEFRDMVKALHRAGIEVILDVVFNHTAEGGHGGPTLCFRGWENSSYYILEQDRARYANYSGTGNTLNANEPIVRRLIVDSLCYWVEQMHVDGFRFDLASILCRDAIWTSDERAAGALGHRIRAGAGRYQVDSRGMGRRRPVPGGQLPRRQLEGMERTISATMSAAFSAPRMDSRDVSLIAWSAVRISSDTNVREPEQSVNFVTCHDGFTLNDLVSYSHKRNEANGEGNRDGTDDNRSWNCGIEGPTDDREVQQLRNRQDKEFPCGYAARNRHTHDPHG